MFNSELRKAADHSASLGLRMTNLASAVGRFPVLGFRGTFEQLNLITGSTPGSWTSEQTDRAVELLARIGSSVKIEPLTPERFHPGGKWPAPPGRLQRGTLILYS